MPWALLLAGSQPMSGREGGALLLSTCDLWPSGLYCCPTVVMVLCVLECESVVRISV